MFELTTNYRFSHLLRKIFNQNPASNPLEVMTSDWVAQMVMTESLETTLSDLLSSGSVQYHLKKNIKHFHQLFLVTRQPRNQVHCRNRMHLSSAMEKFLVSATLTEDLLTFKDQENPVYFVSWVIESQTGNELGRLFVSMLEPAEDVQVVRKSIMPLLKVLKNGLETSVFHQQKMTEVIHSERQTQAADLHDTVAQVLSYVNFKTSNLNNLCQNVPEYRAIRKTTEEIQKQVSYANRLTRELINTSRVELCEHQLSASIVSIIDEYEQLSSIVFEVDNRCKPHLDRLENANEVLLIIRESLNNLVRHSHATHARLLILKSSAGIELTIEDNGVGIFHTKKRTDSHGLIIMQERARKIGAKFSVKEREGGGTIICLVINTDVLR